jgi:hypothetical protein
MGAMMERVSRRCLCCGGTELLAGSSLQERPWFRLPGASWWQRTGSVGALPFACLNCGGVSYFLSDEDLERVRCASVEARANS